MAKYDVIYDSCNWRKIGKLQKNLQKKKIMPNFAVQLGV